AITRVYIESSDSQDEYDSNTVIYHEINCNEVRGCTGGTSRYWRGSDGHCPAANERRAPPGMTTVSGAIRGAPWRMRSASVSAGSPGRKNLFRAQAEQIGNINCNYNYQGIF
ncbi:MAG: hypothetical protein O7E56_13410, partial [SAR324 cluster bacterium]|nr:hypothetical protein [SAR324 cluster bacterium]